MEEEQGGDEGGEGEARGDNHEAAVAVVEEVGDNLLLEREHAVAVGTRESPESGN